MQVQTVPFLSAAPVRASAPPAPEQPKDRFQPADEAPYEFVFPSHVPKTDEATFKLPEENPPVLQRPVLFVHGYNGAAGNWSNFVDWFSRDDINRNGGVVKGDGTPADPQGKVFSMAYSRPFNSVASNAEELRRAVDEICRATGAAEIDLVAHSKGGLDSRFYIDQGNEKVKHLVMIGTPNHGSILADLELTFRELGLPISPRTDDPEVRQALRDLTVDKVDGHAVNNPTVHGLNERLPQQKERAEILNIDG
ncbi:MAG: alpha/beta fold hydrolase, partial [Candidatus Eremiobacterota bacterium]